MMTDAASDWISGLANLWLRDVPRSVIVSSLIVLITWLIHLWGRDTPRIPWSDGQFNQENLFQDPHTQRLAWLLYYSQPELLQRWYEVVLKSALRAAAETVKLTDLCNQRDEWMAKAASDRAGCNQITQRVQSLPTQTQTETWFAIGLSFMLFLGIAEYLGIEVQSLTPDKFMLAGLALAAAICLTVTAKKSIVRWVKATRSHEPQRSYPDDRRYANTLPFWARIGHGDAAIWLTVLIVWFEMLFAAPGLIGFLPPKLAAQPVFQISAFAAVGLAALINATLAWGSALDAIRWEQRQLEQPTQSSLEALHLDYTERSATSEATLQAIRQQIQHQRMMVVNSQRVAYQEHQRWERSVRQWLRKHPNQIERFDQLYPEIEAGFQQSTGKGHWPTAVIAPSNGKGEGSQ